jgi:hypothetical protein
MIDFLDVVGTIIDSVVFNGICCRLSTTTSSSVVSLLPSPLPLPVPSSLLLLLLHVFDFLRFFTTTIFGCSFDLSGLLLSLVINSFFECTANIRFLLLLLLLLLLLFVPVVFLALNNINSVLSASSSLIFFCLACSNQI